MPFDEFVEEDFFGAGDRGADGAGGGEAGEPTLLGFEASVHFWVARVRRAAILGHELHGEAKPLQALLQPCGDFAVLPAVADEGVVFGIFWLLVFGYVSVTHVVVGWDREKQNLLLCPPQELQAEHYRFSMDGQTMAFDEEFASYSNYPRGSRAAR